MKKIRFFLLCSVFSIVLSRLDINSAECNNYLKKFDSLNSENCVGPTLLGYTGDAAFVDTTANVQVNLRYSDPLFNDPTFWGLVQEDGKTADQTCLDLKLWKFTSDSYADPLQVTDLPFTASSNSTNKWRYLSFTINGADLATRMVQTSNSNQYIYTGYYAVAYYIAGTTLAKYSFYFQFTVIVNRSSGADVSTVFKPLNPYESGPTIGCFGSLSKLIWCTDANCATNTVPNLYLNDQFYIRFKVTTTGLTDYYLTDTVVYYVGDGLYKKTTPISIDNSVKGQVTLFLTADIVWSNVAIQVTSYLSTSPTRRRFLDETTTTYDPISGISETLTCIKLNQDDSTCATCAEQCNANDGIAGSTCPVCGDSASLLAVTLFILLLYVF